MEKIEEHKHSIGHCYRCSTIVEPRLSPQWFVKMKPLAEPAIQAVATAGSSLFPNAGTKSIWTGWRISGTGAFPGRSGGATRFPFAIAMPGSNEWAAREKQTACPKCKSTKVRQDPDVLDTWFSSWLWPFSVFGWPNQSADLKYLLSRSHAGYCLGNHFLLGGAHDHGRF